MSTDTSKRPMPIWMRVPCPTWCTSKHADSDALANRQCFGGYRTIARTLAEPLDELRVGLEAEFRELVPHIQVSYGSAMPDDPGSADYSLTLAEGAELATIIQGMIHAARGQDVAPDPGVERHVDLSLEETLTAQDEWFLDSVHVSLEQDTQETEPRVLLYLGNGYGMELTVAEAEQYAATLLELATMGASLNLGTMPAPHVEPKAMVPAEVVAEVTS